MQRLGFFLLGVLACLLPARGLAGSFTVTPTRVVLDAHRSTALLQIHNEGADPVVIQLSGMDWTQDQAGADRLQPTGDLVIFPKMLSLAPGEQRVVRLGFPNAAPPDRERAFRLYAEELPVSGPGQTDLRMALSLSVPVFVRPGKEIRDTAIDGLGLAGGRLLVQIRNSGNAHILVPKLHVSGIGASGSVVFSRESSGWYVLPGASGRFELAISPEECLQSRAAQVSADLLEPSKGGLRSGNVSARLDIDPAKCKAS
jgi:fimbrial chaperone protein